MNFIEYFRDISVSLPPFLSPLLYSIFPLSSSLFAFNFSRLLILILHIPSLNLYSSVSNSLTFSLYNIIFIAVFPVSICLLPFSSSSLIFRSLPASCCPYSTSSFSSSSVFPSLSSPIFSYSFRLTHISPSSKS